MQDSFGRQSWEVEGCSVWEMGAGGGGEAEIA